MKILLVGNSQLACIKLAADKEPRIFGDHEVHFYVMPGAAGPAFDIEGGRLKVIDSAVAPQYPPVAHPRITKDMPVDSYDLIFVSALGHLDGGFRNRKPNYFVRQGVVAAFGPKPGDSALISKKCYEALLPSYFEVYQYGFTFLRTLRKNFTSRIVLQPFPLMSEMVRDHPQWAMNELYDDPLAAHRFFLQLREDYLIKFCGELGVELLPYPDDSWRKALFTPKELMSDIDGLHPTPAYGRKVIQQLLGTLPAP
jgi:hypothetical protein